MLTKRSRGSGALQRVEE